MIKRKLEKIILEMLEAFRIVAIHGPRQSGKTTLQKLIAKHKDIQYYTFDNPDTLKTASNDPIGFIEFISKENSVAIDEVQMIPEIVPALKMRVDEKNEKGMFLLTGSSDMFKNSTIKESLAGRMVSFNLYPLSYAEINNKNINIIDKFFSDDFNSFKTDFKKIDSKKFVDAVINGGYPDIYDKSTKVKKAWFDSYIKARLTKDIATIENVDVGKLIHIAKLLQVLSAQIGSIVNYQSIAKKIEGLGDKTTAKYIHILEALYIVKLVPAYSNNRLKRAIKSPKVQFIDTGLASYLLNVDADAVMTKRGDVYGNLVESFVYSELIKHLSWAEEDVNIYHYRDLQKKEVDFILESTNGEIVALEIKSGTNLKDEHFKGLLALAQTMKGNKFKGIVLYGGDEILPYKIDEFRFWVIPLKIFL